MVSKITEKVLEYQKSNGSPTLRKELISYCQLVIYTYPASIHLIEEEDSAELLLYVNPRLDALLENFTYSGVPFENYMKKVSYLQAQSFVKLKRNEKRRYQIESVSDDDLEYYFHNQSSSFTNTTYQHCESETSLSWTSDTPLSKMVKEKISHSSAFKRRIIHLILLCSDLLTASHITFLSQFLEIEESELASMIKDALALSEKRICVKEKHMKIRDNHFFEKEFLTREKRFLQSVHAHPYYISKVEKKMEKESRYWYQVCESIKNRPTTVTHSTAGKITGVPKGTVDSGLQSLYRYLHEHIDDTPQIQ